MVGVPSEDIWMILSWLTAANTLLITYVQPSDELLGKDHRPISLTPEGLLEGDLTKSLFSWLQPTLWTNDSDNPVQYNSSQFTSQHNDGFCYYCKRPGPTARFCPFKRILSRGKSNTPTTTSSSSTEQAI